MKITKPRKEGSVWIIEIINDDGSVKTIRGKKQRIHKLYRIMKKMVMINE